MTKFGTVLVFKDGVTKAQAEAALRTIAHVLQPDYHLDPTDRTYTKTVPFRVNGFDPNVGGPVWYIP